MRPKEVTSRPEEDLDDH